MAKLVRRSFWRDNGLTIALLSLFALSLIGQALTGWGADSTERQLHDQSAQSLPAFLMGGEFLSTLFENWESEFLQMWAYVMLTAYLFQRGSPESKDPDQREPQDRDPALAADKREAPWPVRAGGLVRAAYAHSLGIAMLILFLLSWVLHWLNSARQASDQAALHGQPPVDAVVYLADPQFWFESFQNWQSEFFSTAVLIVLAIYLRERGSPESKPVAAPHSQTGT